MGNGMFRTLFPSQIELRRMVEWGPVQAKVQNAKLQIEERQVHQEVKYVLPRVWVQFVGLPSELCEFPIIWAVGTILGVSKEVDMMFMWNYGICRLQVLVVDPNLTPQFVNVVIGDYMYELRFRVEAGGDGTDKPPMPFDFMDKGDGEGRQDDDMEEDDTTRGKKEEKLASEPKTQAKDAPAPIVRQVAEAAPQALAPTASTPVVGRVAGDAPAAKAVILNAAAPTVGQPTVPIGSVVGPAPGA